MKLHPTLGISAVLLLAVLSSACSDDTANPILGALAESASPQDEPARAADPLFGTETVLVVDDDKVVRRFVSSALIRYGYTVLEAGSGSEALQIVAGHAGPLDLLLTEVEVRTTTGLQLADALQEEYPELKVLIMADSAEVSSVPGSVLVVKPFERESLLIRVREVLGAVASARS